MGMYNGRRYDVARIRGYFDDIEAAFDDFKKVLEGINENLSLLY